MSDPGPIPESSGLTGDELAHMQRMTELREAADEKLAKLNELYGKARLALQNEAERQLEPLVQGLYDAMTPILETLHSRMGELLADYRQGVSEARANQDEAARGLRMLHQQRMARLHQDHTRCENCQAWITDGGRCMNCNGQPATDPRKSAKRDRVQS